MEPIVNRVAESDVVVYNLEALWDEKPVVELDMAPFLYKGLVVREKEFRAAVKEHDWQQYRDAHVAIFCSTDAIVPTWAPMLIASKLEGVARSVAYGRREDLVRNYFARALEREDWSRYSDQIVVVKGCASKIVPTDAYLLATQKLQGVARKLMYGEPCSSVPLWRKPVAKKEDGAAPRPAGTVKPAIPAGARIL